MKQKITDEALEIARAKYKIIDILYRHKSRNTSLKISLGNTSIDLRYYYPSYYTLDRSIIENICSAFGMNTPEPPAERIYYKDIPLDSIIRSADPGLFRTSPRVRQYKNKANASKTNIIDTLKEILNPFECTATRRGNITDKLELYMDEVGIKYDNTGVIVIGDAQIKYKATTIYSHIYDKGCWSNHSPYGLNTIKLYEVTIGGKTFYMLYTHQPREYSMSDMKCVGVEYIPCCYIFGEVSIISNNIKGDVPDTD